ALGQPVPVVPEPTGLTVGQLIVRFMLHARDHYVHPDGEPTSEYGEIKYILQPLHHAFRKTPAGRIDPRKLKAVRQLMLKGYLHPKHGEQQPLSREVINQRCRRIVRVWKWAVGEELVPGQVWQDLRAVQGLQKGRTKAVDYEPVGPVEVDV